MDWTQIVIPIVAYLLGMGFAGSFLGRKWMGIADITLHRIFRRKITTQQYLYWKYFCGISNPPKPKGMQAVSKTVDSVRGLFARLGIGEKP